MPVVIVVQFCTFHVGTRTIHVRAMALLSTTDRIFFDAISQLAYCNPFLPERANFERAALGADFVEGEPVWSQPVEDPERPRELLTEVGHGAKG